MDIEHAASLAVGNHPKHIDATSYDLENVVQSFALDKVADEVIKDTNINHFEHVGDTWLWGLDRWISR